MIPEYLANYQIGKLDLALFDVYIEQNGKVLGKGQGRLRHNFFKNVELVFMGEIFARPQAPAEMEVIPRNLFIRLSGITDDEHKFETFVTPTSFFFRSKKMEVVFEPDEIEFSTNSIVSIEKPSITCRVEKLPKFDWEESTIKTVEMHEEKDVFKTIEKNISYDWLSFQLDIGKVYVIKSESESADLCIVFEKPIDFEEAQKLAKYVCGACSLRVGRELVITTSRYLEGYLEKMKIHCGDRQKQIHTTRLPPLHPVGERGETSKFLIAATNFFRTDQNYSIFLFLKYVWSSQHLPWEGRELALGTAVEGLSRFINETWKDMQPSENLDQNQKFKAYRKELLGIICGSSVETDDPVLTKRFQKRIKKTLSKATLQSAGDMLIASGKLVNVEITQLEASAWERMRNFAAHAQVKQSRETNERARDWFLNLNTFYRLLLGCIKWQGARVDWSSAGFPSVKI